MPPETKHTRLVYKSTLLNITSSFINATYTLHLLQQPQQHLTITNLIIFANMAKHVQFLYSKCFYVLHTSIFLYEEFSVAVTIDNVNRMDL